MKKPKPRPQAVIKKELVSYFGLSPKEAGKFARRAVIALKPKRKN